jgi:hypothetical protein
MMVDRLTADVVGLFAEAGIRCMLIKGPVIGEALYRDTVRPYGDSDLLVQRADWERAVAVLVEQGFADYLGPMAHPRMESLAGTAFLRGIDNVDLHSTLEGLEASAEQVWESFSASAGVQDIAGRQVAVPGRAAMLLHLALHAAKHPEQGKPREDLRRGVRQGSPSEWRDAAQLAAELGGLPTFAEGLKRIPEGLLLARSLGVEDVSSVATDLRSSQVPIAEGLHELLAPGLTPMQRVNRAATELFPNPSFMKWWHPFARRGPVALALSYPIRWGWLMSKLPGAAVELQRVKRRNRRA